TDISLLVGMASRLELVETKVIVFLRTHANVSQCDNARLGK
ncbi:MAG: hypothetical protein RL389_587, partial [Actinomycetota bacterium]